MLYLFKKKCFIFLKRPCVKMMSEGERGRVRCKRVEGGEKKKDKRAEQKLVIVRISCQYPLKPVFKSPHFSKRSRCLSD